MEKGNKNSVFNFIKRVLCQEINLPFRNPELPEEKKLIETTTNPKLLPKEIAETEKEIKIVQALTKAFGHQFFIAILLKVVQDVLKFVSPQILKLLLKHVQGDDEADTEQESDDLIGYYYALALFGVGLVQMVVLQQYWKRVYRVGMEMKTATTTAIYR